MNKLNLTILILPIIFYISIILIIINPSKINKFHPITLIIILIIIRFLICLKINFLKKSIISFILFLIIIGGLIVIYIYITRLANNELFSFNYKFIKINFYKILPTIFILLIIFFSAQYIFNYPIESFNIFESNYNYKFINILYKEQYNKLTFFIIIYLYYSIICIINICYKFKAPLRQLIF